MAEPTFENEEYGNHTNSDSQSTGFGTSNLNIPGFESITANFPGNIYSKLASQNGIQPVDPEILAAREPFRTGRFLIKAVKTPPFFNPAASRMLRYIFEDTVKELSGINDYAVDNFKITNGVVRQETPYVGIYKENNGDFNLRVPETAGQLVRKLLDYWFYGISDPKTGICHFYGKPLRAVQPNKAASFLYVLLGPTARPDDIEYACMWHEAIPTGPKHAHNNSSIGEAGSGVEHDIGFTGIFDKGPEIDAFAKRIVEAYGLYGERFTEAALPSYIYKNYFQGLNADDLRPDVGIDMASRLNPGDDVAQSTTEAIYSDDLLSTRTDSVRTDNAEAFVGSEDNVAVEGLTVNPTP
jgi:hypothetical protein